MLTSVKKSPIWNLVLPILLGSLAFVIVVGPLALNPLNENWLLDGDDVTQHYLGWVFFRHSPWAFPIGLNPANGLEFSSSIVYSDSIPLLAFIFKVLSPILPEPFQYMGAWLLLCFILQAWFAWKLVGLCTHSWLIKTLAAGLFIFAPILLYRTALQQPQVAHFFILAALYFNLKETSRTRTLAWLALLVCSLLVNFYIFTMVLAYYLANLLDQLWHKKLTLSWQGLLQTGLFIAIIALIAWQAGYFSVQSAGQWGYGFFKLNLLGLFNPLGWSYLLADIPMQSSWTEGYMYLGLGAILGLILILPTCLTWPKQLWYQCQLRPAFYFVTLGLSLFAITHHIGIGLWEWGFSLPQAVLAVAAILRASARMFWPVYYLIYLFVIYQLCHFYTKQVAIVLLSILLLVQSIDLHAGWAKNRLATARTEPAQYSNPLPDPLWGDLLARYQKIKIVPSRQQINPDNMARFLVHEWKRFGRVASQLGIGTNATYLTRGDQPEKRIAVNTELLERMQEVRYEEDTLYIINDHEVGIAFCGKAKPDPEALYVRVDGYNVLAPHYGKERALELQAKLKSQAQTINFSAQRPDLQENIFFGIQPDGKPIPFVAMCAGWSEAEAFGTWSNGPNAALYLTLPKGKPKVLVLHFRTYLNERHPMQQVLVSINDRADISLQLTRMHGNQLSLPLTAADWERGGVLVRFAFSNPASPKRFGNSGDERNLGIALESAEFKP